MPEIVRLTSLAHAGDWKVAPAVLRDILSRMPQAAAFPGMLVGTETLDDAAVWRLNDDQALVATIDFSAPLVDDPFDFGRIAAANALSDVYAMGGAPILALAVVGMPVGRLGAEAIGRVLAGGASVCATAGVPVAGGHTVDSAEPFYGLVALGLVRPDRLLKNSGGREGDILILTKPLGVGVLSTALRQDRLDPAGYENLIAATTQLNVLGRALSGMTGVHAVTDVSGFGLLGHALEMAQGAQLLADIEQSRVPLLPSVEALVRSGVRAPASARNWESCQDQVQEMIQYPHWRRDLLTDPQTSGGLLIAVAGSAADSVLAAARASGFNQACAIGRLSGRSMGIKPRVRIH